MEWRIGIHIGDVLVEGDDILGDGVNIAARLEGIAEPGGICISEDAFRQVRGKIEAEFADIGEQSLKKIARPLRVYRIGAPAATVRASAPPAALPLPDKPSIAVLPFTNMSGDLEQEYFADGIAEDIITALSRYPSLFVIARNSSFTYHAEVEHARRLAELTIQPNVAEVLLCIAEEFDRLADDFATGEVDFHYPEIPEHS
jgi:adenylate cyclase